MADLSDFNQLIRIFVPGAPDNAIEFAVRESARRFCQLSWYARRSISVTISENTADYTLAPSDDSEEIVGVHAVEFRGMPLDPTRPELTPDSVGIPCSFYFEPSERLVLYPTPDSGVDGESVLVRIAVQPTLASTTVPDDVCREYRQCIANGAIAWLMGVPKQPWTNAQGARDMEAKYLAQTMRAKEFALRHHQPWGIHARRPSFAVR